MTKNMTISMDSFTGRTVVTTNYLQQQCISGRLLVIWYDMTGSSHTMVKHGVVKNQDIFSDRPKVFPKQLIFHIQNSDSVYGIRVKGLLLDLHWTKHVLARML